MTTGRVCSPAFPGLSLPWVAGLALEPGLDLKTDPRAPVHAAAVARVAADLGLDGIAWARQVHGGRVLHVDTPGCAGEADALWTDVPGLGVMGRSADCPLVLIAARRSDGTSLWGMAHASWRATVAGIVPMLMDALVGAGADPAATSAWIAPSAGPCCYEVGPEVRAAALAGKGSRADGWFPPRGDRYVFDLWAAACDALSRAGVPLSAVEVDGRCTICGEGFPSYRRDGAAAGRFSVALGRHAAS